MADEEQREVHDAFKAMLDESDRGCVLAIAAWMDDILRNMIDSAIRSVQTFWGLEPRDDGATRLRNRILNGPLGRAGNRVLFCQMLGLIDSATKDSLECLFEFRNHFAHFAGVSSLDSPLIKKDLDKLLRKVNLSEDEKVDFSEPNKYSQERKDFMSASAGLVLRVLKAAVFPILDLQKFIQAKNPSPPREPQTRK